MDEHVGGGQPMGNRNRTGGGNKAAGGGGNRQRTGNVGGGQNRGTIVNRAIPEGARQSYFRTLEDNAELGQSLGINPEHAKAVFDSAWQGRYPK
jgi:hypothetical protein